MHQLITGIYFLFQALDSELLWIQRAAIFFVGVLATLVSLFVPLVYGLFILAADVVFVIVFPQLICAVYFKWTNSYGAVVGYLVGVVLRVGAGEPTIHLPPFIFYPEYDEEAGQSFPFRTFAMVTSLLCIIVVSIVTNIFIGKKSKTKYSLTQANVSISNRKLIEMNNIE